MLNSYKSEFPNQVHQLNVSISQHYYLLKDNTIKWQEKKFEINWDNYTKSSKKHLVTFIIRDHFSSCFYAELHQIDKLPSIEDFLFNAWAKKENYEFWGIGHYLIIPQKTQDQFPQLLNFFKTAEKITLQTPTSGFSSAVRSIREWERQIKFITLAIKGIDTLQGFQHNINYINRFINNGCDTREDTNLQKWLNNNPQIISTKEKECFMQLFKSMNNKYQ